MDFVCQVNLQNLETDVVEIAQYENGKKMIFWILKNFCEFRSIIFRKSFKDDYSTFYCHNLTQRCSFDSGRSSLFSVS